MRFLRASTALPLLVLAAGSTAAVLVADQSRWNLPILALLVVLAMLGDYLEVDAAGPTISASFLAIGLAMVMLGPVPAIVVALPTTLIDAIRRRPAAPYILTNVASFTAYPVLGAVVAHAFGASQTSLNFAPVVIVAFLSAITLNFACVAVAIHLVEGRGVWQMTRDIFIPLLPSQLAVAILGAFIVYAHAHGGGVALMLLIGVVVLYQYLLRELLLSKERAEQLGARTTQLASLQVGVLTAMLQTLSLRDKMTARHCAAVARYAKEIAKEYGMDDEEQDLVHTAGLLHDIGKFIFPDSILMGGNKLTDEEYEIVKKHPAQGAKVVRGVDGYGPVADIILAHHERIDGRGYPNGIVGDDIPIQSRMISVADTYDVMTARDSYREPVSPAEAVAELRRVSGAQLDGELVELFIKILERKGVKFHHGDDADFESELDLERRIRKYAEPRTPAAAA
jgi:putative nucleotidyltransferase with HDIG domain